MNAYGTDRNNFAPSIGVAWTVGGSGVLGLITGRLEGDSVLRGGYTLPTRAARDGGFRYRHRRQSRYLADRESQSQPRQPRHAWHDPLRNPSALGPPPFATTRVYPMTDVVTGDIMTFDPNLQVPSLPDVDRGLAAQAHRRPGVRSATLARVRSRAGRPTTTTKSTSSRTGSSTEFRQAQRNLQANIAAARGNTFAYSAAGTAPLPIFLAYFNGLGTRRPATRRPSRARAGRVRRFRPRRGSNPFRWSCTTNTTGTGLVNDDPA